MVAIYNYDYVAKFIFIGEMGVGKSSLLRNFTEGAFSEKTSHTIGVEFGTKIVEVEGERVKIQAWDTAGQERFRSVTRSYYRGSIGTILVYDITSRESFERLGRWLADAKQLTPAHAWFVLVGNKADRGSLRAVSYDEGRGYAEDNGMLFAEASAKTGAQVDAIFVDLVTRIVRAVKAGSIDLATPDSGVQCMNPAPPPPGAQARPPVNVASRASSSYISVGGMSCC
ncbi:Golgi to endosome transport [Coemansia sp. RSA 552]|nr:Golgi to endosome transport [Coemansia sp. RSA 552]